MSGLRGIRSGLWTVCRTVRGFGQVHALLAEQPELAGLPAALERFPRRTERAEPRFGLAGGLLRLLTPLTPRSRRQPCLYRALVLSLLARDARLETEIAVGLAPLRTGVTDHVWLVHRGEPLGDLHEQHRSFPELISRHDGLIYMTTETEGE